MHNFNVEALKKYFEEKETSTGKVLERLEVLTDKDMVKIVIEDRDSREQISCTLSNQDITNRFIKEMRSIIGKIVSEKEDAIVKLGEVEELL